ncbi:MAG: hypothetical protein WCW67_02300 [Candidatus Margulisiibacteriota bacterium]|jgi:Rod binding domain-containing protein
MIEGISPVAASGSEDLFQVPAAVSRDEQVKEEFMTMFYKEMLKQTFKAPKLGPVDDENAGQSAYSTLTADLMVEQLARQMAQSANARPAWLDERVREEGAQ